MERRLYQMEKHVHSLMEEQKTMQEEMRIKQDKEADALNQPHSFGGIPGPVAATAQRPMPFYRNIPWDTYKLQLQR